MLCLLGIANNAHNNVIDELCNHLLKAIHNKIVTFDFKMHFSNDRLYYYTNFPILTCERDCRPTVEKDMHIQ